MDLIKDLRYAARSLAQQPAFAIVAVITLALGIGANTAIFSIVNTLILSPPLLNDPDRVVALWKTPVGKHIEGFVSYLDVQDWRTRNHSFEDIAGYKSIGYIINTRDDVERVAGMRVTANFFPLMRVNLYRGRNFEPAEEKRGAAPVAILSYEFWQNRFGGAESILNSQLTMNGKEHTIIGILPPRFQFPLSVKDVAVWSTVSSEGGNLTQRGAFVLYAVGRLKPVVTLQQAQSDMIAVGAALAHDYPESNRDTTVNLIGAHEQVVGRVLRRALWLLLGAVGFILLIACTNTANLLLVRASTKEKEIAIRAALGAGRARIARLLLTESILLSLFSGGIGLLVAIWGVSAIKFYAADLLPRLDEVRIDYRVLIFTLSVSVFTGLLFSLIPTLKATRPDINEVLKSGSKAATSGQRMRLWRDSLVVAEVALSLILLVGAGLMIRSFAQLVNVPPGFDPANVLTGRVVMVQDKYEKHDERVLYVNQTLDRLRSLPGVISAGFIAPMPFSGANVGGDFRIEGKPKPEAGREPTANVRSITNEYFQTIKIPLIKGRYFSDQDKRGDVGAAIINQTFARIYFPDQEPLGQYISGIGANQNEGDPKRWEIVGVIGDIHHNSLTKGATAELYLPYQQNSWSWGGFLIRTNGDPSALSATFREQIRAGDRSLPVTHVRLLKELISDTVTQPRFYTFLFGLFGALGLVLTATGVYGVISYTVSQRTQEIGIRMALGATGESVVRLVLAQGVLLALVGTVIGLAISFGLSRLIAGLLFGVTPTDVLSFIVAALVLLLASFLASYIPARRATKVDPITALRCE